MDALLNKILIYIACATSQTPFFSVLIMTRKHLAAHNLQANLPSYREQHFKLSQLYALVVHCQTLQLKPKQHTLNPFHRKIYLAHTYLGNSALIRTTMDIDGFLLCKVITEICGELISDLDNPKTESPLEMGEMGESSFIKGRKRLFLCENNSSKEQILLKVSIKIWEG